MVALKVNKLQASTVALISLFIFSGCNTGDDIQLGTEYISTEGTIISTDSESKTITVITPDKTTVYLDNKTIIIDSSSGQYDFADLKSEMLVSLKGTKSESGRITAQSITILPSPDKMLPSEIIPPESD